LGYRAELGEAWFHQVLDYDRGKLEHLANHEFQDAAPSRGTVLQRNGDKAACLFETSPH
jgi:hypothetical protein